MSDQGSPSLGPAARQAPPPAALPASANGKAAAAKPSSKPAARKGSAPASTPAGKQQPASKPSKPKPAAPSAGDTFAESLGKAPGTCLGPIIDYEAATVDNDPTDAKNASQLTRNLLFSPTHSSYMTNASIPKKDTWASLREFERDVYGGSGEYILLPYAARDSTKNARPVVPAIQVFEGAMHLVYFVYGDNPKPKHKVIQYGFNKLYGRALSGNIKLVDASPCANDIYNYDHFDYQMRYILHMLSSSGWGEDSRPLQGALYERVSVYKHEKDFKRLMEMAIKIAEAEHEQPRSLPVKLVVLDRLDSYPKTNLKGHPISMGNLGEAFHSLSAALPCKNDNVDLLLSWLAMSPSATLDKLKAALPKPTPGWFAELSARPPAVASSGEKRGADAVQEEADHDASETGEQSSKKQKTGDVAADLEPGDVDDEMRGEGGDDEKEGQEEEQEQEQEQRPEAGKEKQPSASKKKKRDDDEESELSGDGSDDGSAASSDDDESEEEESDDSDEEDSDSDDDDSDSDEPKKKKPSARKAVAKTSSVAPKKVQPSKKALNPPKPSKSAERVAEAGEETAAVAEAAAAEPEPAAEGVDAVATGGDTAVQRPPRRPAAEGDGKSEAPALKRRKPICLQIQAALRTMEPSLATADSGGQMASKIEKIKDALKAYEETGKVHATESLLTLTGSLMLAQARTINGLLEQNDRAASKAAIRKMETAMETLGDETPTLQELSDVLNKWATKTTEMMAARMRCTRELDRATLELSSASGTADAGAASSSSTQESGSQ